MKAGKNGYVQRRMIEVLAVVGLAAVMACSGEPEVGERCPSGAEYDTTLGRCVIDNLNHQEPPGNQDPHTPDAGDPGGGSTGPSDPLDTGSPGEQDTGSPGEQDTGSPGEQDTGSPGGQDTGSPGGQDTGSPGEQDTGSQTEPVDPPPTNCSDQSLSSRLTTTALPGDAFWGRIHATAGPNDGAFVAGQDGGGGVEVRQLAADGSLVASHDFAGDDVYGLAASDTAFALLVYRAPDVLALIITDHNGTVIDDQTLIGDVDQSETWSQWFGHQIRDGRLTEAGGQWAAYYTVQQLWDDGVAHYGDQLRVFDADGSPAGGGWNWGCSHSMEVRISHNGTSLGPLCSSDCYPSKGVHFNHQGGRLWTDEEGSDCWGGYATSLGGSIPVDGGFWMIFAATDERDSYDVAVHFIDQWSTTETIWLTEDDVDAANLNGAMYGDELLVAWTEGATWQNDGDQLFARVSHPGGAMVGDAETVDGANLEGASDFFNFDNGDVGWLQGGGTTGELELARLGICP